jgi:hypothetical protein
MGYCFDCVEAESIIQEGRDMYDEELSREEKTGMSKSMAKLKFLIKKGWVYSPGPKK